MIHMRLTFNIQRCAAVLLAAICLFHNSCTLSRLIQRKNDEKLLANSTFEKFELRNNIMIPTAFKSGETEKMALDLGAGTSLLLRYSGLGYIDTLSPVLSYGKIISADHQIIETRFYSIGTIQAAAFSLENAFLPILPDFQTSPCNKKVGIWGADLFEDKTLVIRMQDSTLAVFDSCPSLEGWTLADAEYKFPLFYVFIKIGDKKVKLLFDTGCTSGIVMNRNDFEKIFPNGCPNTSEKRTFYGKTFVTGAGPISDTTVILTLDEISLGSFQPEHVNLTLSEKIKANVIGMDVISRFNVLLDYQHEKLYFQENPNYQEKKAGLFVKMGFNILVTADGGLEINALQLGSPAERSGLKIGDRILSFNGIKSKNGENCDILHQIGEIEKTGKEIEIIVARGNETLTILL